jgi:uncharacterized protein YqeY
MSLVEKIHEDMVGAMKQRAVDRLSTLRMVKAALKNKEIDQRAPVTDAQAVQVLTTSGAGSQGSGGDHGY